MKAVSTWNTLQFPTEQRNNTGNLITLGAVIVAIRRPGWLLYAPNGKLI